ncbi:MAG: threonine synthase [Steroidobacteraceae bacterium]
MNYRSTRDAGSVVSLSRALEAGIAADGGLYVPERLPTLHMRNLESSASLVEVAESVLAPFFDGDELAPSLPSILGEAFNFPAPLRAVAAGREKLSVLELFHGPTAAFKDFGARFLAACLARIPRREPRPLTILVATSGDTGGAVAAAFHRRAGFRVVLLFPAGKVSPIQERQLTCWGDNVRSFAVRGTFDDCQRLVKRAFGDPWLAELMKLGSANSINVGRLLPQMTYFAAASLEIHRKDGGTASFVIPSGNLGHAVACIWARELGLPIGDIILAHNANRTVPDYLQTGEWRPRPSTTTLATAMDVGDPSNMERLGALYGDHACMTARLRAVSVGDDEIRASIRREFRESGLTLCPHGAVAAHVYRQLKGEDRRRNHWVLTATAHPAKFPEVVEPLIGEPIERPPQLSQLLGRNTDCEEAEAHYESLRDQLLETCHRLEYT